MSFPLAALPYGLLRRLHEIATEYELFQLADASSAASICPRPFQRNYHRCGNATFLKCRGKAVLDKQIDGIEEIDHIVVSYVVKFVYLEMEHLKSEKSVNMSKFMLKAHTLELKDCDMSKEFLERVASMFVDPRSIRSLVVQKSSVNLEDLFNIFPNVTSLTIRGTLPSTWPTDILQHQQCKLKWLKLSGEFAEANMFDLDKLQKFIKAQEDGFYLFFQPAFPWCAHRLIEALSQLKPPPNCDANTEPKAKLHVKEKFGPFIRYDKRFSFYA